jgi:hypothetical protein
MKNKTKMRVLTGAFLTVVACAWCVGDLSATPRPPRKKKVVVVKAKPQPPRKGIVHRHPVTRHIVQLPAGHRLVVLHNRKYYFHNGLYYWPGQDKYFLINGPRGFTLDTLPPGHQRLLFRGIPYFHYAGTYYSFDPAAKLYTVIEPPPGIEVAELPEGYETPEYGGIKYYQTYADFYKFDPLRKVYIVVRPPAGLKVQSIPYEFETETRDGREIFISRGVAYEAIDENGVQYYRII